jgi:hypothetical protein
MKNVLSPSVACVHVDHTFFTSDSIHIIISEQLWTTRRGPVFLHMGKKSLRQRQKKDSQIFIKRAARSLPAASGEYRHIVSRVFTDAWTTDTHDPYSSTDFPSTKTSDIV